MNRNTIKYTPSGFLLPTYDNRLDEHGVSKEITALYQEYKADEKVMDTLEWLDRLVEAMKEHSFSRMYHAHLSYFKNSNAPQSVFLRAMDNYMECGEWPGSFYTHQQMVYSTITLNGDRSPSTYMGDIPDTSLYRHIPRKSLSTFLSMWLGRGRSIGILIESLYLIYGDSRTGNSHDWV